MKVTAGPSGLTRSPVVDECSASISMSGGEIGVCAALEGQSVFITGASGFVGKVVLEKLLRSVSGVRHVFLLVRPKKGVTPAQRVQREIVQSAIFNRLRKEIGEQNFQRLVDDKLVAISGDISHRNCGIGGEDMERIAEEVSVMFHCAASIDFTERIDKAVELNIKGVLRMYDIALQCKQMKAFVHMSTCYVNSNQPSGSRIEERLYPLGFDPEKLMADIAKMSVRQLEKIAITGILRDWPNTYTFTKAIAEQLLVKKYEDSNRKVPLAIIRPAIVGACWREPMPGWLDDISAASFVIAGMELGILRFMPGDYYRQYDIVPADLVANVTLLCAPAVMSQPDRVLIAHAGSSHLKPCSFASSIEPLNYYVKNNPPKVGIRPPNFQLVNSPQVLESRFFLEYSIPSAILNTLALTGNKKLQTRAKQFEMLIFKVRSSLAAFRFFLQQQWTFLCDNSVAMSKLYSNQPALSNFCFNFDGFSWDHYMHIYSYGVMKFVFQEDLVEIHPQSAERRYLPLNDRGADIPNNSLVRRPPSLLSRIFPDSSFIFRSFFQHTHRPFSNVPIEGYQRLVLSSAAVQDAIKKTALKSKKSVETVMSQAKEIVGKMAGDIDGNIILGMGYLLRKVFRQIFDNVYVNPTGLEKLRTISNAKVPIVFIPTHRSYIDFLLVSFVCLLYNLPIPFIAAGEDFLGMLLVRSLFRNSGAFFLRRSFAGDELYTSIFEEYIRQLLLSGQSIEFFIEGTRSRSGKMLHPKTGMLGAITKVILSGDIDDICICPITINYEKTLEGELYKNELLGEAKIKESLYNLIRSLPSLFSKMGRISVKFSENPISLKDYYSAVKQDHDELIISPSTKKQMDSTLAYAIINQMSANLECMATHLLAALILMYRQGITKAQLLTKMDWLMQEVGRRGGHVAFMESWNREKILNLALHHLRFVVAEQRKDVFEPLVSSRNEYQNMLLLGHYRNKIVHLFWKEAIWSCAIFCVGGDHAIETGVEKAKVLEEVLFLKQLMHREVTLDPSLLPNSLDLEQELMDLLSSSMLKLSASGLLEIPNSSEMLISFLCSICWPFVDSYFVTALTLFTLQPDKEIEFKMLVQRAQWLATTLYHENMLCFYESCSTDTLQNALQAFEDMGVIEIFRRNVEKKIAGRVSTIVQTQLVRLQRAYQVDEKLQSLVDRINRIRKSPPIKKNATRRAMIADIPLLAKI